MLTKVSSVQTLPYVCGFFKLFDTSTNILSRVWYATPPEPSAGSTSPVRPTMVFAVTFLAVGSKRYAMLMNTQFSSGHRDCGDLLADRRPWSRCVAEIDYFLLHVGR
jgi:hypothetical protein